MKKINFRSILFILYSLILAILVTTYMGDKIYLLNFYMLPILFAAYYFDIFGAVIFVFLCSILSVYFMHNSGVSFIDITSSTPMAIQIIIFTVVGIIVGIFQRENNKLNNYLLKASLTDKLTDLYNYGYFTKRINEEISRADRYKHFVSLIMIDIDNFKQFNDTYGHQKGNQVLIRLAQIIVGIKRQSDIAFRYGGEEFCIILPETRDEAIEQAERLREEVSKEKFAGNVKVTISAGVCIYPCNDKSTGLVERADNALYEAKATGRNKICVYKG